MSLEFLPLLSVGQGVLSELGDEPLDLPGLWVGREDNFDGPVLSGKVVGVLVTVEPFDEGSRDPGTDRNTLPSCGEAWGFRDTN